MQTLVECVHCGWIHFSVSLEYAKAEVAKFNAYYDTLSAEKQQDYYGGKPSTLALYSNCQCCGRPAECRVPTKTLKGSTIGPLIWPGE